MRLPTYSVISPVRDEAEHLARTATSMLAQTHPPLEWVIVDDGSSDGTRAIAEAYASEHDWISVVSARRTHRRARGAPIVEAFEDGRATLRERPDVIVKLDGDLFLPSHFFAWVGATFTRDPRAGIVGGVVWIRDGDRWRLDGRVARNVNGVAKAYSTDCLDDIGGLRRSMGWDGIDEYGARARGWNVRVLEELSILHYKPRGSKQPWHQARWEEGLGNHYMGYYPLFLLLRAGYRMLVEPPRVLGGVVLATGFAYASLRSLPRVDDPAAIRELRTEQRARMRHLLGGKRRAIAGPAPLPGGGPAFWLTDEPTAQLAESRDGHPRRS